RLSELSPVDVRAAAVVQGRGNIGFALPARLYERRAGLNAQIGLLEVLAARPGLIAALPGRGQQGKGQEAEEQRAHSPLPERRRIGSEGALDGYCSPRIAAEV